MATLAPAADADLPPGRDESPALRLEGVVSHGAISQMGLGRIRAGIGWIMDDFNPGVCGSDPSSSRDQIHKPTGKCQTVRQHDLDWVAIGAKVNKKIVAYRCAFNHGPRLLGDV